MSPVMGTASLLAGIPHDIPSPRSSSAVKGPYPCHTTRSLPAPWLHRPGGGSASLPVAFGQASVAGSVCLAAVWVLGRSSGGAAGLLRFGCQLAQRRQALSGDEMCSDEMPQIKLSHSPTIPSRFPGFIKHLDFKLSAHCVLEFGLNV